MLLWLEKCSAGVIDRRGTNGPIFFCGNDVFSLLFLGEGSWDDVFPYFFGGEELGIMCFPFVFHTFLGGGGSKREFPE